MAEIVCFQGDRITGKTTKLIELADRYFSYMVVENVQTVQWIERKAREEGKKIPQPLTYYEFSTGKFYGAGIKGGFVIDNIERLLCYMAKGVRIRAFSLDTSFVRVVNLNLIKEVKDGRFVESFEESVRRKE